MQNKIIWVRKRGFFQSVAKYEDKNQANILTRISAKLPSVLKKRKKKQQQNLTFEVSWTRGENSLFVHIRMYLCSHQYRVNLQDSKILNSSKSQFKE